MKVRMLGGFLVAAGAYAAVHNLNVPFEKLSLLDGRELSAGSIRSYDDLRGTVVASTGRELITVPIAQLPENLAAKVRSRVPERTAADLAAEKAQAAKKIRDAEKKQNAREREIAKESLEISRQSRAATMKTADRQEQFRIKLPAMMLKAAEVRAKTYFGSGRFELDEPEPVPGWSGRYRVRGTAFHYRKYSLDAAKDRRFEVILQADDLKAPKVLEVNVDN